jgi:hypothetical protein
MGWLEPVKGLLGRGLDKVKGLLSVLAAGGLELLRTRRRGALIFLGAFGLILLISLLAAVLAANHTRGRAGSDPGLGISDALGPRPIPPEELFLPEEPDFLPEVLLERERRDSWTVDDARPFWVDPLEAGREVYIDRMSREIDTLLERIP